MRLAFDIEANGLNEVVAGKKDTYIPEATKIWCMSVCNVDTNEMLLFEQDNLNDGINMLRDADMLIGHNIYAFDIPLIERLFGSLDKKPEQIMDTLILSRLVYGDNPPTRDQSHSLMAWGEHLGNKKIDYQGGYLNNF